MSLRIGPPNLLLRQRPLGKPAEPYFAYSTARVSRMTVTLIWPG